MLAVSAADLRSSGIRDIISAGRGSRGAPSSCVLAVSTADLRGSGIRGIISAGRGSRGAPPSCALAVSAADLRGGGIRDIISAPPSGGIVSNSGGSSPQQHLAVAIAYGDEMLHLLGHSTYLFLFNRPLLSIFRHLYGFASKMGSTRGKLWDSCVCECWWARNLVCLSRSDLRRSRSSLVLCSDASEDGFGVMKATIPVDDVYLVGRWRERWRHDGDLSDIGPRALVLRLDPIPHGTHSIPEVNSNFVKLGT